MCRNGLKLLGLHIISHTKLCTSLPVSPKGCDPSLSTDIWICVLRTSLIKPHRISSGHLRHLTLVHRGPTPIFWYLLERDLLQYDAESEETHPSCQIIDRYDICRSVCSPAHHAGNSLCICRYPAVAASAIVAHPDDSDGMTVTVGTHGAEL